MCVMHYALCITNALCIILKVPYCTKYLGYLRKVPALIRRYDLESTPYLAGHVEVDSDE